MRPVGRRWGPLEGCRRSSRMPLPTAALRYSSGCHGFRVRVPPAVEGCQNAGTAESQSLGSAPKGSAVRSVDGSRGSGGMEREGFRTDEDPHRPPARPATGSPLTAAVVVLALNPSFHDGTVEEHEDPWMREQMRTAMAEPRDLFWLRNDLATTTGGRWRPRGDHRCTTMTTCCCW